MDNNLPRNEEKMSTYTENTYGNIQNEERYKKLERTVKLLLMKQKEQRQFNTLNCHPAWPSMSSINGDHMDSSFAGFLGQTSRFGNDIVASSNIINKNPSLGIDRGNIVTSSVKKFPSKANDSDARVLMPPPKSTGIFAYSSRKNSPTGAVIPQLNSPIGPADTENEFPISAVDNVNSKKCKSDSSHTENDNSNQSVDGSNYINRSPDRIFHKWKVSLNDKSQLIIKGFLECGRLVRSKPVIQRLTSNKVLSIHRYIYSLEGNIFDDKLELPEFIRGKFYNGFPDDWENIVHIWKDFKDHGCNLNFRWPTPVTDDDDDLLSEITEVSVKRRDKKKQRLNKKTINDVNSNVTISPQSDNKRDSDISKKQINEKQQSDSGSIRKSSKTSTRGIEINNTKHDGNNTIDDFIDELRCSRSDTPVSSSSSVNKSKIISLSDLIHEDKLKIIFENLMKPNCSIEYKEKLCQMLDCLKYFICLDYDGEDGSNDGKEQIASNSSDRQTPKNNFQAPNQIRNSNLSNDDGKNIEMGFGKKYISNNKSSSVRKKLTNYDYESMESSEKESGDENNSNMISKEESMKRRKKFVLNKKSLKRNIGVPQKNPPNWENCHRSEIENENMIIPNPEIQQFYQHSKPRNFSDDSDVSFTEDDRRITKRRYERTGMKNRDSKNRQNSTANQRDNYKSNSNFSSEKLLVSRGEMNKQVFSASNTRISENRLIKNQIPQCEDKKKFDGNFHGNKENHRVDSTDRPEVIHDVERIHTKFSGSVMERSKKPVVVDVKNISQPIIITENPNQATKTNDIEQENCSPPRLENSSIETKDLRVTLHNIQVTMNENNRIVRDVSKNDKNVEEIKSGVYGSKLNPMSLTSWRPELKKKASGEFGLVFKGTLFNEAGHAVDRKHSTSIVLERINSRLIETVNHEFYKLVGDLSDTKHIIPNELRKLCHNGCPARIHNLCEKLEELKKIGQIEDSSENDLPNVSVSMRGRRILPPLNYWQGEKLMTVKGKRVIYDPGNSHESSIASTLERSGQNDSQKSPNKQDTSCKDSSTASFVKKNSEQKERTSESKKNDSHKDDSEVMAEIRGVHKTRLRKRVTRSSQKKYMESSDEDIAEHRRRRSTKRKIVLESKPKYYESSDVSDDEPIRFKRKKPVLRSGNKDNDKQTEKRIIYNDAAKNRRNSRKSLPNNRQSIQVSDGRGGGPEMTVTWKKNVPYEDDLSVDEISVM